MPSIRDRAGAALFRLVAGPEGEAERERIHGTPGPRWFDADSAIARVHGDASMFIGGIRAVMLQSLHPVAMAAVSEHSGFRGDLWGRLARTSTFLATTTFGAEDDAERATTIVKAVHRRVTGTMPDGTAYMAADPHLLLWVHVAEIESFLLSHQRYGGRPLDRTGADAYVAEAGLVARKLGVIDPPGTEAELASTVAAFRAELRATPAAHEAIEHLRRRAPLPTGSRPAYDALWRAAADLLPAWARAELGLPHHPKRARLAGRVATTGIRWALVPGQHEARRLQKAAQGAT